ncbi:ndt80-like DNA-binding family protein [Grosmannia clavigera kw1407]|uniref:Ndt80-like DNA-binding family protein n=1 Tax=Grosmannia clavigera (strain kw1407 / UAMH 11150) TaxID=655863 RepID=F0XAF0_GROCL|nr:ndt80-like DNA-binding family protein [Grosmannia clavigera kw1407]EFX05204.1 ndt80-like DNA-binding family protein [Grosmannia clavigera kw1407]
MDSNAFGSKSLQSVPPLAETTAFGTLHYADGPGAGSPVKLEINGTIDKGFFLADNEWTCYRRNYFSCICSFSLSPHYPSAAMTFVENGTGRTHNVHGFAMSISAIVSDNESHIIELVQHTPKRDKGPTARPDKTRLKAKPLQASHHSMSLYGTDSGMPVANRYDHGYGPPQSAYPTEHTYERIQFKQATANNGKRRAAQQYYHLLVELWADVGAVAGGGIDPFIKVAHRKSAKMIVRGRSPGHYQSERRGSTSSGPGGSAGSLGYGGSQAMGSDFGSSGSAILPGAYGSTYDPRSSSHYGGGARHHQHTSQHHHEHEMELDHQVMSTDEVKAIAETKEYQYYPAPICNNTHDPRQPVELFSHSNNRNESDQVLPQASTGPSDVLAKVKQDPGAHDGGHIFYAGNSFYSSRCSRYEGKPTSSGYYPASIVSASSISMS